MQSVVYVDYLFGLLNSICPAMREVIYGHAFLIDLYYVI